MNLHRLPLAYTRRQTTPTLLALFSTEANPTTSSSPSDRDEKVHASTIRQTKSFPVIAPRFPKRIILLRHGESLGNVDESLYGEIPDWKIPLTRRGEKQSLKAATDLYALTKDEVIFCYCSPYTRTKETWKIMSQHLVEQGDVTLIGTREEPRIAEQQFGNFQSEWYFSVWCAYEFIIYIIHPTLSTYRSKKGPNGQD